MFSKNINEDKNFIYDVMITKNLNYYRRRILLPFYDFYMKFLLNLYYKKSIKYRKFEIIILNFLMNT